MDRGVFSKNSKPNFAINKNFFGKKSFTEEKFKKKQFFKGGLGGKKIYPFNFPLIKSFFNWPTRAGFFPIKSSKAPKMFFFEGFFRGPKFFGVFFVKNFFWNKYFFSIKKQKKQIFSLMIWFGAKLFLLGFCN